MHGQERHDHAGHDAETPVQACGDPRLAKQIHDAQGQGAALLRAHGAFFKSWPLKVRDHSCINRLQRCTQEDAAENQRHKLSGNYGKPYEVLFVKDVR